MAIELPFKHTAIANEALRQNEPKKWLISKDRAFSNVSKAFMLVGSVVYLKVQRIEGRKRGLERFKSLKEREAESF